MTNLTIVTSCHNYGQYLKDWATSLVKMNTFPDRVVIVNNGSTDDTAKQVEDAFGIITKAGIACSFRHIERTDFGSARNVAVSMAETEWVQHFDCDDMAMPHMVDDFLKLANDADVVAMGYERSGNLKEGPSNRTRVYRSTQGQTTLKAIAPASGVSPFRKSFWEQRPYRTDMKGGWDTALWLGFAHLNARFLATKRPCFWYRQHGDSIFNTRRANEFRTQEVGTKLQSLRRGDSGVSVIVPFLPDGGARDRAWEFVSARYHSLRPDWEVVLGTCPGTEWRKGYAVDAGVQASKGEVLIIADADCIVPFEALDSAVELVRSGEASWVVPHTLVKRLNRDSTEAYLQTAPTDDITPSGNLTKSEYQGYAGGGIVVVERAKYDFVGGIPRGFVGWGAEDEAFALILDTMLGKHTRLKYDLFHLYHPTGKRAKGTEYRHNRALYNKFLAYSGDPERMWHAIQGKVGYPTVDLFPYFKDMAKVLNPGKAIPFENLQAIRDSANARTHLIRAEQQRRNQEATERKSFERRRLEAAGRQMKLKP